MLDCLTKEEGRSPSGRFVDELYGEFGCGTDLLPEFGMFVAFIDI